VKKITTGKAEGSGGGDILPGGMSPDLRTDDEREDQHRAALFTDMARKREIGNVFMNIAGMNILPVHHSIDPNEFARLLDRFFHDREYKGTASSDDLYNELGADGHVKAVESGFAPEGVSVDGFNGLSAALSYLAVMQAINDPKSILDSMQEELDARTGGEMVAKELEPGDFIFNETAKLKKQLGITEQIINDKAFLYITEMCMQYANYHRLLRGEKSFIPRAITTGRENND
jgi:hypothetical protein